MRHWSWIKCSPATSPENLIKVGCQLYYWAILLMVKGCHWYITSRLGELCQKPQLWTPWVDSWKLCYKSVIRDIGFYVGPGATKLMWLLHPPIRSHSLAPQCWLGWDQRRLNSVLHEDLFWGNMLDTALLPCPRASTSKSILCQV